VFLGDIFQSGTFWGSNFIKKSEKFTHKHHRGFDKVHLASTFFLSSFSVRLEEVTENSSDNRPITLQNAFVRLSNYRTCVSYTCVCIKLPAYAISNFTTSKTELDMIIESIIYTGGLNYISYIVIVIV